MRSRMRMIFRAAAFSPGCSADGDPRLGAGADLCAGGASGAGAVSGMLHMASVETAKESERGIVDMETLKHTNEQLISTLDEVLQIQTEGAKKRQEAEVELRRLEGELKQKLLQPRS